MTRNEQRGLLAEAMKEAYFATPGRMPGDLTPWLAALDAIGEEGYFVVPVKATDDMLKVHEGADELRRFWNGELFYTMAEAGDLTKRKGE